MQCYQVIWCVFVKCTQGRRFFQMEVTTQKKQPENSTKRTIILHQIFITLCNSLTLLLEIITDGKVPQILTAGLCTQKTYFLGRFQPLETGFLSLKSSEARS